MFRPLSLLLVFASAAALRAQTLVPSTQVAHINDLINENAGKNSLKCTIRWWEPNLDFNLRFVTGFHITARVSDLAESEQVLVVIRVTPTSGKSVLLAQTTDIVPPSPNHPTQDPAADPRLFRMSLSFAVGEGHYNVDAFVLDKKLRRYHRRWKIDTPRYNVRSAPPALSPRTVAAIDPDSWDGKLTADGLRLTVLLDAAPVVPTAAKLRSSDRVFLLQSLSSLLKQMPVRSVKVVAFNLEQQREIFRQDNFDSAGFDSLAKTLENLGLNTVSVNALHRDAWLPFLLRLATEQASPDASGEPPADAVIFLGPNSRLDRPATKESIRAIATSPVRFFYLEYYGFRAPFPDAIDHLTRDLHGSVYHINTASEFAAAIQKILTQVQPSVPAH